MKMKDAFEKHPDLQQEIIKLDLSFNRPNILCKTLWKELEKLDNTEVKLLKPDIKNISFNIHKNDKSAEFGFRLDERIKKELHKLGGHNSYSIEYIHCNGYSTSANIGLSVSYNKEETQAAYNKRQAMLKIKQLFVKYIVHDMEYSEQHKKQIQLDKKKLKDAYDAEVKYLKEKYQQK